MAANDYFTNADARLWTQLDGPGSAPVMINCADIGDVDEPLGDVTRELCPDPVVPGAYNVAMRAHGQPGEATIQFTVPRGKTSDYLDKLAARRCTIPFYVLYAACSSRDVFLPLDVDEIYHGYTALDGILTSKGRTNQGSALRDGAAPSGVMRTYAVSFRSIEDWYKLVGERQLTVCDEIQTGVASFNHEVCGGACGGPEELCERLVFVGKDGGAAKAFPYFSGDGGATWTVAAAAPYAASMNLGGAVGWPTGTGSWRVLVNRATTDAGPADVAYTDDLGATWVVVDLPTPNAEFVKGGESMVKLSRNLLFVCTGGAASGSICRGTQSGTAWELVATTPGPLNCIDFLNEQQGICAGDDGLLYKTIDGGNTWGAATDASSGANDIVTCAMMSENHWLVGYSAAFGVSALWQTFNGGLAWEPVIVNAPAAGATAILPKSLRRVDDHCVWMGGMYTAGASPFGFVARNVAGGASGVWEHEVTALTTTEGINGIYACGYNKCYGVGGLQAATATVLVAANE